MTTKQILAKVTDRALGFEAFSSVFADGFGSLARLYSPDGRYTFSRTLPIAASYQMRIRGDFMNVVRRADEYSNTNDEESAGLNLDALVDKPVSDTTLDLIWDIEVDLQEALPERQPEVVLRVGDAEQAGSPRDFAYRPTDDSTIRQFSRSRTEFDGRVLIWHLSEKSQRRLQSVSLHARCAE
jgi:hypothetical protein